MSLLLVREDITKMRVDAIVNAANETLLGGGGVDGAIHRAAGPGLLAECRTLGGCRTGEAKLTAGYELPARYVIHTVGPVWQGGGADEETLLRACYRNSLTLAAEKGLESVAFPLISSGVYGYPKREALHVAVSEIRAFLADHELTVYLTVFDRSAYLLSEELFRNVRAYVDDHYVETHYDAEEERRRPEAFGFLSRPRKKAARKETLTEETAESFDFAADAVCGMPRPMVLPQAASAAKESLEERLAKLDEGFSRTLLRLIDEAGLTDAECYKRANVDRKLFSKIRSNPDYRPSKTTALAFCVALRLDLPAAEDLLRRAGYALSNSSLTDVVIRYFIENGNYDIDKINYALFSYDQAVLG